MPSAEAGHPPSTLCMPSGAARWPLCHPTMMAAQRHIFVPSGQWESNNRVFMSSVTPRAYVCVYVRGNAKVNTSFMGYSVTKGTGGDVTQRESQSDISCLDLCQGL